LAHEDPQSVKKSDNFTVFIALLGSARRKATQTTLMKLTPGVNIANNLGAAFAPIFFCQKISKPNCKYREKLHKSISYQKASRKIMVKLTPDHDCHNKQGRKEKLHFQKFVKKKQFRFIFCSSFSLSSRQNIKLKETEIEGRFLTNYLK